MLLTQLPPEILHNILSLVELDDLTAIQLTCRFLNNFIQGNNALCRAIYLRLFDEPPRKDLDFTQEIRDLVRLKTLCAPTNHFISLTCPRPSKEVAFVHSTVTRLLQNAVTVVPPPPPSFPITPIEDGSSIAATGSTSSEEAPVAPQNAEGHKADHHPEPVRETRTATTTAPAKRASRSLTYPTSRNAAFLAALFAASAPAGLAYLTRSSLFDRYEEMKAPPMRRRKLAAAGAARGRRAASDADRQLSAKLNCLYGPGLPGPQYEQSKFKTPADMKRASLRTWGYPLDHGDYDDADDLIDFDAEVAAEKEQEEENERGEGVEEDVPRWQESEWWKEWPYRGGVYALACSKVYDLREHTTGTKWGPFLDQDQEADGGDGDGRLLGVRVDWEKMEAILIVLWANIRSKRLVASPIFANIWARPFAGVWGGSYIPWSKEEFFKGEEQDETTEDGSERVKREVERRDPYGVSGCWLRVVCFLDYADFLHYNFELDDEDTPPGVPRPPLDVGEATRLILMKVRATRIEPPGEDDHPGYPVVHFVGVSRALDGSWDDNADSDLRGTVRMTPEGEVRWTSCSIFHGEERWKSEGIQIGGIRSARGVVGTWFDKDYSEQGPCGPTAFWKVSDPEGSEDEMEVLVDDVLPIIADDFDEVDLDGEEDDDTDDGFHLDRLFEREDEEDDYEDDEDEEDENEDEDDQGDEWEEDLEDEENWANDIANISFNDMANDIGFQEYEADYMNRFNEAMNQSDEPWNFMPEYHNLS